MAAAQLKVPYENVQPARTSELCGLHRRVERSNSRILALRRRRILAAVTSYRLWN
jgi:hypothetical protein